MLQTGVGVLFDYFSVIEQLRPEFMNEGVEGESIAPGTREIPDMNLGIILKQRDLYEEVATEIKII